MKTIHLVKVFFTVVLLIVIYSCKNEVNQNAITNQASTNIILFFSVVTSFLL